jgi:hypothetical protein
MMKLVIAFAQAVERLGVFMLLKNVPPGTKAL